MARGIRIEYAGAVYPVMRRGNQRQAILQTAAGQELVLTTLVQACEQTGWRVHDPCFQL
jgi:hypothetical protein